MIINHNIAALNTYNKLSANNATSSKALEKLSSGLRINRAGDDAAGLAISEKMRGQIRGLDQATRNAQDGISLIQTAEGALNETHSILQRMRELAVQAASDTNTDGDRAEIQKEITQLKAEITRISTDTEFNTKKLLNGNMGKLLTDLGTGSVAFKAGVSGLAATGSDLGGSYQLVLAAVGTNTAAINSNSIATGLAAANITAQTGQHAEYGHYRLEVSNFGSTADLTLTGPDGQTYTSTGAGLGADISLGGITFAFSAHAITGNGALDFDFTANGLQINLTGDKTVTTTAIASYAGEKLNIGGFEFTLQTNHGILNDQINMTVQDKSVKFHIGANAGQNVTLAINDMSATALRVNDIDLSTQTGANAAITTIETALETVSSERAKLGAMQNRLEHTINNLTTSSENLSASESRIRDVDMAKEMMNFTKTNILSQAATAMLAQANQQPQGVLQLLK